MGIFLCLHWNIAQKNPGFWLSASGNKIELGLQTT